MAILGLTDKGSLLPNLGELRKGGPKEKREKNGRQYETYGKDLENAFRFTSDDSDVYAAFTSIYGEHPTQMRVFIPYNTVEEAFDAWKEEYTAGGLKHRCDGKTCALWLNEKDGTYQTNPIPCPGGCKPTGRLRVWIPELGRRGIITVLTTSIHDIMNLHGNLLDLQDAAGKLRGIPFLLRRVLREISTPQTDNKGNRTGKRARREKWLIAIEPETAWVNLLSQAQQQQALSGLRGMLNAAPADVLATLEDDDEEEENNPVDARTELDPTIQKASDEEIALYESLLNVWVMMGKPREEWIAYCRKQIYGKSVTKLRSMLADWQKVAAEKAATTTVEAEEVSSEVGTLPDDLLASIEREKNTLRLKLVQENEIQEKVMKITSGEVLEDCTAEVLGDVLLYLQNWAEKLKPLTKTA